MQSIVRGNKEKAINVNMKYIFILYLLVTLGWLYPAFFPPIPSERPFIIVIDVLCLIGTVYSWLKRREVWQIRFRNIWIE